MRFAFVDALRAVAALSVVLFRASAGDHIPILYGSLPFPVQMVIAHGDAGVAFFFVLSGFVIAHSLRGIELTLGGAGRRTSLPLEGEKCQDNQPRNDSRMS